MLKKIRLARQTDRCRRSAHQEVMPLTLLAWLCLTSLMKHLVDVNPEVRIKLSPDLRFLFLPWFRVLMKFTYALFQMSLVSRVQHPYVVEYKESWVEKVRSTSEKDTFKLCLILMIALWRLTS